MVCIVHLRYQLSNLFNQKYRNKSFSFPLDKEDEGNRQRVADFETTMEHAGIYLEYA